jgi:hypothetical protein
LAYATSLFGATAMKGKRLVPFHNLWTNGGGLKKDPRTLSSHSRLLRRKIKGNLTSKWTHHLSKFRFLYLKKSPFLIFIGQQ